MTGDQPLRLSVVEVQVGKKRYPMYSRPSCRTCQSQYRYDIEQQILSGISYVAISEWVAAQAAGQPGDSDEDRVPPDRLGAPGMSSLRGHAKNHMPPTASFTRDLLDERALELADGVADAVRARADHIALARLMVQRGLEGLADGTLEPDMSDVMNAAKFLAVHDVKDDSGDNNWREIFMAYLEVTRSFIPAVQWTDFGNALSAHPALRAIAAGTGLSSSKEAA